MWYVATEDGKRLLTEDNKRLLWELDRVQAVITATGSVVSNSGQRGVQPAIINTPNFVAVSSKKTINRTIAISGSSQFNAIQLLVGQVSANILTLSSVTTSAGRASFIFARGFVQSNQQKQAVYNTLIDENANVATVGNKKSVARPLIEQNTQVASTVTSAKATSVAISASERIRIRGGDFVVTSAIITASGSVQSFTDDRRPDAITSLRAVRVGDTITLTWVNPINAFKIEVYRSVGQRNATSLIATVNSPTQSYVDAFNDLNDVASYQLVPFGITGLAGKSTYIVYTGTNQTQL